MLEFFQSGIEKSSLLFFHLIIITLTGAFMNIGYNGSAPMTYIASKGQTHDIFTLTGPILKESLIMSLPVQIVINWYLPEACNYRLAITVYVRLGIKLLASES